MAHTSLISPALSGSHGSSRPVRSHFVKRRRVLAALLLALVLGLAALTNYGPLSAYRDARSRLDTASAQMNVLAQQKEELQTELGRLSEAGYLESLARQELTYAKPGEEVYIVGAAADGSVTTQTTERASSEKGEKPGFLEKLLSALGGLF
jgi:cell division protein FtsB